MTDESSNPRLCGKGVLVGFGESAWLVLCAMVDDLNPAHAEIVRAVGLTSRDEYATLSLYDDGSFELMNVRGEERLAAVRTMARRRPEMAEYVDLEAHLWDFG